MPTNNKNVILIVADAMRPDRLSHKGYRRKGKKLTPNLDKLAEEGKFFDRAYSPGPWTAVAQPAILTGEYDSNISWAGGDNTLPKKHRTIAEAFKDRGYETRGYNMALFIRSKMDFDRGFDYYEDISLKDKFEWDFWHMEGMLWNLLFGRDCRTRYALKSIKRWIRSRDSEKPFFLFWNPTNPHAKYEAPRSFRREFEREIEPEMNKEKIEEVAGWGNSLEYVCGEFDLSEEEMEVVESRYDAEIAYLDYRVGQLVDFLKEKNLYEDTIIAFTSDHGENFADKDRLIYHDIALNEALINVPLIISGGGVGAGDISDPVSTIDLFNSLLKKATGETEEDIESNSDLLHTPSRSIVFSEREESNDSSYIKKLRDKEPPRAPDWYSRGLKCAIKKDKKLLLDSKGEIETYTVEGGSEVEESIPEDLEKELLKEIEETLGGFGGAVRETDERVKERLKDLGYI